MKKPTYASLFPENSDKKIIAALRPLVKRCDKVLSFIQLLLRFPALKLAHSARTQLAEILVDFAMDIHFDTGIWTALEKCNTKLFGTPLPLVLPVNAKPPAGICVERVQFLLWNTYLQLTDYEISNSHVDMLHVAEEITEFLNNVLLPLLPAVSPVKEFLDRPNNYGWEVKKKLIWLGTHSYLFRLHFDEYFEERYEGGSSVMVIDDFICQNTTCLSGLGVNDILAACLDIPDGQKDELRNWYLRHFSLYKIVKTEKGLTEAVNLITDESYQIREKEPTSSPKGIFSPNSTIYGGLVPWCGEWYWSGAQHDFTPLSKKDIAAAIRQLKQNTQMVARYWKERDETVRQRAEEIYQHAVEFYGDNLVEFPSGRAWKRSEIKRLEAHAKSVGQKGKFPRLSFGEELQDCEEGIAMFFDPVEGSEIMDYFDDVRNGLKKNGKPCTEYEVDVIRGWINSPSISPGFVHRVLEKYGGAESIKRQFCWETDEPHWLDYLLRCRKGEYYRRRFPSISIVDKDDG